MFDTIAGHYDLVNRLISLGLDRLWRRKAIGQLALGRGSLVLDIGCGTGDLVREATRAGHGCIGVDLSYEMLLAARNIRVPLIEANAEALPFDRNSIDGVVSGFALRNFAEPRRVFTEVARVLVPGGHFVILEIDQPHNPLLRMFHGIWFNSVVPMIGALFSEAAAYRYLPKSVAYLPGETDLKEMLGTAGFDKVSFLHLQGGLAQIIVATNGVDQR